MAYIILRLTQHSPYGTSKWEVFAEMKNSSNSLLTPKINNCSFDNARVVFAKNDAIASLGSPGTISTKLDSTRLYKFVKMAYNDIQIPVVGAVFDLTLEGTGYTLEFDTNGFRTTNLTWWSSGPEEWEPLAKWFREMTTFLDDAIENQAL